MSERAGSAAQASLLVVGGARLLREDIARRAARFGASVAHTAAGDEARELLQSGVNRLVVLLGARDSAHDAFVRWARGRAPGLRPVVVIPTDGIEAKTRAFGTGATDVVTPDAMSDDWLQRFLAAGPGDVDPLDAVRHRPVAVVDDSASVRAVCVAALEGAGFSDIHQFADGDSFLDSARSALFAALLCDVVLPGVSGISVVREFRAMHRHSVVVSVSSLDASSTVAATLEAGADDFITKPFDAVMLLARLRKAVRVRLLLDELEQRSESLALLASTDGLTGIANRAAILAVAETARDTAARSGERVGLVLFDVDRFKAVNDTHGHLVGDAVLISVAHALQRAVADAGGAVGRYGGEEFLLVVRALDPSEVHRVADGARVAVAGASAPERPPVTVSAGAALVGDDGQTVEAALRVADRRLYLAKEGGRDRVVATG